jgi:hypothetical protein
MSANRGETARCGIHTSKVPAIRRALAEGAWSDSLYSAHAAVLVLEDRQGWKVAAAEQAVVADFHSPSVG